MDDNGTRIDGMEIAPKLILEIGKVLIFTAGPLLLACDLHAYGKYGFGNIKQT